MNESIASPVTLTTAQFFVSYAHRGRDHSNEEVTVRDFFTALQTRIQQLSVTKDHMAAVPRPERIGAYDRHSEPGGDLKRWLAEVLSDCQVFVPLYSPSYFTNPWAMRELEVFQQRVLRAGADPAQHIVPVQWTPFIEQPLPSGVQAALEGGPDLPEYRSHGLERLGLLHRYRHSYDLVVDSVAQHVVEVLRGLPLHRSQAPAIDEVQAPVPGLPPGLTVCLLRAAPERFPTPEQPWWNNRSGSGLALAAATAVEQLGLETRIEPWEAVAQQRFGETLGMVMVDPWAIEDGGPERLRFRLAGLPPWVTAYVLRPRDRAGRTLVAQVQTVLSELHLHGHVVDSFEELVDDIPHRVALLRAAYLELRRTAATDPDSRSRVPRLKDATRWRLQENETDE